MCHHKHHHDQQDDHHHDDHHDDHHHDHHHGHNKGDGIWHYFYMVYNVIEAILPKIGEIVSMPYSCLWSPDYFYCIEVNAHRLLHRSEHMIDYVYEKLDEVDDVLHSFEAFDFVEGLVLDAYYGYGDSIAIALEFLAGLGVAGFAGWLYEYGIPFFMGPPPATEMIFNNPWDYGIFY